LQGATGKDRYQKQQLAQQLMRLQVAYDRLQENCGTLQQEHDTLQHKITQLQKKHEKLQRDRSLLQRDCNELNILFNYADKENKDLDTETSKMRSHIQKLESENAALQGRIAVLEHKLEIRAYNDPAYDADTASLDEASKRLLGNQADFSNSSDNLGDIFSNGNSNGNSKGDRTGNSNEDTAAEITIDLSNVSLALVGGHETTHREVAEELKKYGLKRCIHVPPHSRESNSRHQIRDKISNCDLVVTITSYVDHSVSNCVKQLKDTQVLTGEVIRVHCHGKSGVVREVLEYFASLEYLAS